MKYQINYLIASLSLLFFGCEEYQHGPISNDTEKPAMVENVITIPTNGGFNISYDLPQGTDLLYVKAEYLNSKKELAEVKASIFDNEIQILGLGNTKEKTIKIYTVDRSNNQSEPVIIKKKPLISPVQIIQKNLLITSDFGGAKFSWENKFNTPISIDLLAKNEEGKIELIKTQYTEQASSKTSVRGFAPKPTLFCAIVRDRYDNFSDTIYAKTTDLLLTPLFEERLDKKKFKKIVLQNDDNWDAWSGDYWNFFDDNKKTIVHTPGDHVRPSMLTVDLGVNVTLSRFTLYQTTHSKFAYTHGNPKKYTVYGTKETPGIEGNLDDWILLRHCESTKPSGLPIGQNTDEDMDHAEAGDQYTFDKPIEIRYFRIAIHETWNSSGITNAAEITFWGQIKK